MSSSTFIFTARIRSIGKVMFLHMCVCLEGYPLVSGTILVFFPWSLVPGPFRGTHLVLSLVLSKILSQVLPRDYPCPSQEYPHPWTGKGYPLPPVRIEAPPGQESQFFLCSRQYTSCGHTGGLSCLIGVDENVT